MAYNKKSGFWKYFGLMVKIGRIAVISVAGLIGFACVATGHPLAATIIFGGLFLWMTISRTNETRNATRELAREVRKLHEHTYDTETPQ